MTEATGGRYVPRGAEVDAVIFDMDGLLVDSEPFWRLVETRTFDELGVDIRALLGNGATMGMRVDDAVRFFVAVTGVKCEDLGALTEAVVDGVVAAIEDRAALLPGAIEAIEFFASRGLRVALASGSVPPVIDAVLDRFALRERFEMVSSAIDDLHGKPNPSIFLRTAHALGVDPVSCLVLEDSLNGCIAAKAARMAVIAIPHVDDADDPRFSIADCKLASLLELGDGRVDALLKPVAPPPPL